MNQVTEFLQSEEWLKFQEAAGKEVVRLSSESFSANGIMHTLPIIGKYLYVPRGPICQNFQFSIFNFQKRLRQLMEEAKKQRASWIRVEPETEDMLQAIKEAVACKVVKAPHDVQPREVFVIDITRDPETLLADMKPKTRYNIRLAEKRGVKVYRTREKKHREAFLHLITTTADRKDIVPHPRAYYEHFFTSLPEDMCQLFVAEYDGQVVAANLLIILGTRATYLHGGSGNEHRDAMAPYLLQWEQMKYAKERGCTEYDFGGIKTMNHESGIVNQEKEKNNWRGITKFKRGFSPETEPMVFPGAYDVIINQRAYTLYTYLRRLKESVNSVKKIITR